MSELFWFEKYRPRSFEEVVDLEEVKARLREFVKAGNLPHLLFYGPPGTGKTTMALVLARELYGEYWRENTLELNASDERGIGVIRERVKEFARTAPVGKAPFKLVILDEADNMSITAVQNLSLNSWRWSRFKTWPPRSRSASISACTNFLMNREPGNFLLPDS